MGIGDPNLSASRQIIAHIGGMMLSVIRHYPVNWAFHWNGIRRAISSGQRLPQNGDQEIRRKANGRQLAFLVKLQSLLDENITK
jgi:hypothetical protein